MLLDTDLVIKGSEQTIMAMNLSFCNLFPGLPGQGSVFHQWVYGKEITQVFLREKGMFYHIDFDNIKIISVLYHLFW